MRISTICYVHLHSTVRSVEFIVTSYFTVFFTFLEFKMSRRVWLLVEWLDDKNTNVLPSYGTADTVINRESDIRPGQVIYIQPNKNGSMPRKAQVLKISGIFFLFNTFFVNTHVSCRYVILMVMQN